MVGFTTRRLPRAPDAVAPDGAEVRVLLALSRGSMVGTHFQFRSLGGEPLAAIGVTMPPWPGEGEAVVVPGPWERTVP